MKGGRRLLSLFCYESFKAGDGFGLMTFMPSAIIEHTSDTEAGDARATLAFANPPNSPSQIFHSEAWFREMRNGKPVIGYAIGSAFGI